jgi:hypothetical protein
VEPRRAVGTVLLVLASAWTVVQWLNVPADLTTAAAAALAYGPLLLFIAAFAIILLSIEPVQDRVFNQAVLRFLEPRVDDTTSMGMVVATGPSGTLRFVGLPPGLGSGAAVGSNAPPYNAPPTLHDPTFPWFLFLPVKNVAQRTRATEVRAEYVVRRDNGSVLFALDARWRESPQVASGVPSMAIKDIIDIPAGRSAELDFAVQHRDRDYACAFNTEVTSLALDWCLPQYQLAPGYYWLKARLIALNARTVTAWFEIVIGGAGMMPTIRQGTPPPEVR